jgi:hypothetical protein
MIALEFWLLLRDQLQAQGLLGDSDSRDECAARARARGELRLVEVKQLVGEVTVRRALSMRRGQDFAESYRYVTGYGELMTEFLISPVALTPAARDRVARLGAIANLIVSHFDELVDGGWPRVLLLPRWALPMAATSPGRALLLACATLAPAPTRLIVRLVAEYFRRVSDLPYATLHAGVCADLRCMIAEMYMQEGRTPREWQRRRGDAAAQKKTALPLVVLGLPAWLASPVCPFTQYQQHRRWLVRIGKFIRWIDDAADLVADEEAGSANLVSRALTRRGARTDIGPLLAAEIARRGRLVLDEWRFLTGRVRTASSTNESAISSVFATVLAAWLVTPKP